MRHIGNIAIWLFFADAKPKIPNGSRIVKVTKLKETICEWEIDAIYWLNSRRMFKDDREWNVNIRNIPVAKEPISWF